jgi:NAD(P)-dependent dehydrogenase (short-subunit alcohol dehydrogenase family)
MTEQDDLTTVLVTGAGRRLGQAIALDFAHRGWRVGVHYNHAADEASGVVAHIERMGGQAVALEADLANFEELGRLVEACADQLGPPTCLVNNAACFEWDSIKTLDAEHWQMHLDVNLRAPIFLVQTFVKTLPAHAFGNVINVIDQKILRPDPEFFSYTIAKSALWTATQTLAQALAPRIRVNAIAPGPVLPSRDQSQADFARECRTTLLQRVVSIDDVTGAIRFLLETPSITGQLITLDSGQHLAWIKESKPAAK